MTRLVRRRAGRIVVLALALSATAAPVMAVDERTDAPATSLRVTLDRLLAEHAFLTMVAVRSAIAESPDYDAAGAALDANTAGIVASITDIYGEEAGDAFGELWRNHIGYLVDYTRALEAGDDEAASLAAAQLDRYVADFTGLLADAMPVLPRDTVRGLIGEHVEQLGHVAAFQERDFGQAYPAMRETFHHMFDIGDGLTIAIVTAFPDRFAGREEAFSPATDLRVTLDRLLGEHTYLAALAMRAALTGAPDVMSAADALSENSHELQAIIADIYGAEAGDAFGGLWGSHVDSYFAYVTALAKDDEAAAAEALADLTGYRRTFSAFVADANPFLPEAALRALIEGHTDHLVRQANAFDDGEYEAAHRIGREAYAHTAGLSASLAAAISDQFPLRYPDAALSRPEGSTWGTVISIGLMSVSWLMFGGLALRVRAARAGGSASDLTSHRHAGAEE